MLRTLVYTCFLLIMVSCSKEHAFDCFKSTGSDITESRSTGSFAVVQVNDQINLNIVQGADFKVEVKAGKHIIQYITTKVKDNTLILDNTSKCNFVRGYKREVSVTVTVPYLTKVENLGVGTVTFDGNYTQDTLIVRAESSGDIYVSGSYKQIRTSSHGNGDIYLDGSCNSLYVYMDGINFLRGNNLRVKNYIFVESLSIGDCYINTSYGDSLMLDYHIWSTGNVYYKGDPYQANNVGEGGEKGKLIKD